MPTPPSGGARQVGCSPPRPWRRCSPALRSGACSSTGRPARRPLASSSTTERWPGRTGEPSAARLTVVRTGIGRVIELDTDELPILPVGEYYEVWFVAPDENDGGGQPDLGRDVPPRSRGTKLGALRRGRRSGEVPDRRDHRRAGRRQPGRHRPGRAARDDRSPDASALVTSPSVAAAIRRRTSPAPSACRRSSSSVGSSQSSARRARIASATASASGRRSEQTRPRRRRAGAARSTRPATCVSEPSPIASRSRRSSDRNATARSAGDRTTHGVSFARDAASTLAARAPGLAWSACSTASSASRSTRRSNRSATACVAPG